MKCDQRDMKFDFDAVFYYLSDLERAIKFYTNVLGFELQSKDYVARFQVGHDEDFSNSP